MDTIGIDIRQNLQKRITEFSFVNHNVKNNVSSWGKKEVSEIKHH